MWKNVNIFIGAPALVVAYIYCFHVVGEEEERIEYAEYDHIMIRRRKLPFGDGIRSLLHNPRTNPVPGEGYDAELEEHGHH